MNHYRPAPEGREAVGVTPESADWRYLSFRVLRLQLGETITDETGGLEVALLLQEGRLTVQAGGRNFTLARADVFTELPHLLYLPPGTPYTLRADTACTVALGGAPAEGRLPLRLFTPGEMRVEMRGGANAIRQVTHALGPDLPAERLLIYEVYTPSGNWSGWPPHRHDGQLGSLYIEESYHYRVTPTEGWAVHRNYSPEDGEDELILARDGDLVLARRGYHPVAAAPGSNVYYLNFMAGDALMDERRTSPVDEAAWAWMRGEWTGRALKLPIGRE